MPVPTATANPDHYLVSANGLLGLPPRSPFEAVERYFLEQPDSALNRVCSFIFMVD